MYLYQITNLINNKIYIGQTNDITKRWSNHKCCHNGTAISRAIQKYGAESFKFEVLYRNIPIDEIDQLEIDTIKEKNSLTPNGYNISEGGQGLGRGGISRYGADNPHALLTQEEAQYILDNRDKPMYILYPQFSEKITYKTFKKIYNHSTYTNLSTNTKCYPYNLEYSSQFTSGRALLEYDEVVALRKRYANLEFWKDVYQDYKHIFSNQDCFWRVYNGYNYKLVMPEVFTEENRKAHASLAKQGSRNGRAKLTEQDVRKIRELRKQNVSYDELSKIYPQVKVSSIKMLLMEKLGKICFEMCVSTIPCEKGSRVTIDTLLEMEFLIL